MTIHSPSVDSQGCGPKRKPILSTSLRLAKQNGGPTRQGVGKEAWDDFASLSVQEFSRYGNISIVATLDLEEMSGGLSRWVRRGFSGTFSPQNVA